MSSAIRSEQRQNRRRYFYNLVAEKLVAVGGLSVIFTIALIFGYLLWVVVPAFFSAKVDQARQLDVSHSDKLYYALDERNEFLISIDQQGNFEIVKLADSKTVLAEGLEGNLGAAVVSVKSLVDNAETIAVLLAEQKVALVKAAFQTYFDGETRKTYTSLEYPYAHSRIDLLNRDNAHLVDFSIASEEDSLNAISLLRSDDTDFLYFQYFEASEGDEFESADEASTVTLTGSWQNVVSTRNGAAVYLFSNDGRLQVWDARYKDDVKLVLDYHFESALNATAVLVGGQSLLVAQENVVSQFQLLRFAGQWQLTKMRDFQLDFAADELVAEYQRKGFAAFNNQGEFALLHATSSSILTTQTLDCGLAAMSPVFSPRNNRLLCAQQDDAIASFSISNEHPEISFSALWQQVWYEAYQAPNYTWQSSSADSDSESKFSLTPLAFGTFKAAFYAMIFAAPMAICAAIYTAYFMAPTMRAWVKPSIEIMEAFPTVILGFLAGLWLAPIVETHMVYMLSLFLGIPLLVVVVSFLSSLLPAGMSNYIPQQWYAAFLVPLILLFASALYPLAPVLEFYLFDGNMPYWLSSQYGIEIDQRNALVVGIAMGLAVIPSVFSITEDAIYSVPAHLTQGSLALGASLWQTLMKVVLLTALPGIFSALMIGFGRAIGETMIVLMATGNTAIMDFSIFQGMRTFSANIAVELPEAAVNSSHYRILFLSALVLFIITFAFNTAAELIRQRLRERYGNL